MLLSEDDALVLILRHWPRALVCSIRWADASFERYASWADEAYERVDLVVGPTVGHSGLPPCDVGARIRLALGVLQAVSCCRGFALPQRQAFWRRVAISLNRTSDPRVLHTSLALSATAFTVVGIRWKAPSHAENVAFWTGFLHGTGGCAAALTAALDALRPFLATTPLPPLRVALSCCTTRGDHYPREIEADDVPYAVSISQVVSPETAHGILLAAMGTSSALWTATARTQLGLVLDVRVEDDLRMTHETLRLLAAVAATQAQAPHRHAQITVDRLAIQLAPPRPPRAADATSPNLRALVARGRALGPLLRQLLALDAEAAVATLPVHSVALHACSQSDFRLVGAALSAVAAALSRRDGHAPLAALRCSRLFDTRQPREHLLRLAWLALVLLTLKTKEEKEGTPPMALALLSGGVALTPQETAYVLELASLGTPLRDVVGEALRLRFDGDDDRVARLARVECLVMGSTVQLRRGATLYYEPFRTAVDAAAVKIETAAREELAWIAHVEDRENCTNADGGSVGVVFAGYGLVWTPATSVVAWRRSPAPDRDQGHTTTRLAASLASLTLSFEGARDSLTRALRPLAHRVATLLPLLASASLHTLTLVHAVVRRKDLACVLASLPNLRALTLDRCVVESVAPLVATLDRLEVLSLRGSRDLRFLGGLVDSELLLDDVLDADLEEHDAIAPSWVATLVDALALNGVLTGLRELHIDIGGMASELEERATLSRLASAVTLPSRVHLARLHVASSWRLNDMLAAVLGPLRGMALAVTPRRGCAALSVLRLRGCAAPEIARTVLALAHGDVVRVVTWDPRLH